jgi:hypothetical protein
VLPATETVAVPSLYPKQVISVVFVILAIPIGIVSIY